jgi:hypothetical protein
MESKQQGSSAMTSLLVCSHARSCALVLLLIQATACSMLTKGTGVSQVPPGQQQDVRCSDADVARIVGREVVPDATADTVILECALNSIRAGNDPALLRSATGTHISFLLADRTVDAVQRETWASGGVSLAETALAQGAEQDGAVHYYLAANLGWSVRAHPVAAMQSLPRMESELMHAIQLTPELDQGGPLRTLGMLYLKAPPWPGGIGDGDKALELLRQVVEQYPDHPLNHLFYAQALLAAGGADNISKAGKEWNKGNQLLITGKLWVNNRDSWGAEFSDVAEQLGLGAIKKTSK